MIGKKQFVIDAQDFALRGMSSGVNINDGAFSNETEGVNLIATPGVLHAPAAIVDSDTDTRLTGNIIASSPDMEFLTPTNRLLIADTGTAYRYNGTKISAAAVSLTAAQTWTKGFTDIVTFGGEAYVSSKASLTRWQSDNTIDAGASWPFSFANATVPHPGIVYENNMYWGDKNLLKIQSSVGDAVAPTTVLTLATDQVIMALGIDPGTGLMLISTSNVLDVSSTIPSISKILWYDGNSAKVVKSVVVDEPILGFHAVGGNVFVGYGNNLGYMNGSGIAFLRKLKNVTADNTQLPYKHNFTHIGSTLYVLDGLQILAYGEVIQGRKIFYYAFKNNVNSNKMTFIANVGSKKLGFGFATTKFYTLDTSSVSDIDTLRFNTNRYYFERPVFLRNVYIEYATSIANNDNNRTISYLTEAQGTGFEQLAQVQSGATSIKNSSGAAVYFIDNVAGFTNNKVRWLQLRLESSTSNAGIKRIIVSYDYAE